MTWNDLRVYRSENLFWFDFFHSLDFSRSGFRSFLANPAVAKLLAGFSDFVDFSTDAMHADWPFTAGSNEASLRLSSFKWFDGLAHIGTLRHSRLHCNIMTLHGYKVLLNCYCPFRLMLCYLTCVVKSQWFCKFGNFLNWILARVRVEDVNPTKIGSIWILKTEMW